jgi:arylsulfatase A-like enzyme
MMAQPTISQSMTMRAFRIANAGLRYTQFHSTALCSPTRAALITGRNHHSVGFGVIAEMSTGYHVSNAANLRGRPHHAL